MLNGSGTPRDGPSGSTSVEGFRVSRIDSRVSDRDLAGQELRNHLLQPPHVAKSFAHFWCDYKDALVALQVRRDPKGPVVPSQRKRIRHGGYLADVERHGYF